MKLLHYSNIIPLKIRKPAAQPGKNGHYLPDPEKSKNIHQIIF